MRNYTILGPSQSQGTDLNLNASALGLSSERSAFINVIIRCAYD